MYHWIYFDLLLFRLKEQGGKEAKGTAFGMFFLRIKVACSVLWLLISLYQRSRLITDFCSLYQIISGITAMEKLQLIIITASRLSL
jgi:hypothetical protein